MKWTLMNQPATSVQKYHLLENNVIKMTLKYNHEQQTARISSQEKRRLFFIEKTGLRGSRILFKNEYGVEVGRLWFDKAIGHTGNIDLENTRFHYSLRNMPVPQLVIFERSITAPLLVCNLIPSIHLEHAVEFTAPPNGDREQACLLLGLCWYLFLPATPQPATLPLHLEKV